MAAQNIKSRGGPGAEGFDSISAELETVAVLCSAVPEIDEELRTLTARVDTFDGSIDGLEGEIDELRGEVEDLSDAFCQLTANVAELEETVNEKTEALEQRANDLETRLESVESCLDPDLLDERQAHVEAQDDSIPFDRGDERDLFIKEVEAGANATLRGEIDKVQTFVDVDAASEYEEGDVLKVVITDLNGTAAHAAPAAEFEG